MKVSFLKKINLYRFFRKTLKLNSKELSEKFGVRIDYVSRIYTVLNIPTELIDEPYNLRKGDIDNISKQYIKEYVNEFGLYLDSIGLKELYKFYKVSKVDKYSYLVVFGYSLVDTVDFARSILFKYIPGIIVLMILSYIILIL